MCITELDFPIGSYGKIPTNITYLQRENQAKEYGEIFAALLRNSDSVARVTFWGKNDDNSWDGRGAGEPLLFDRNFQKKISFDAVVNAKGE